MDLLELRGVEPAGLLAGRLGDLVVDEVHPADRVDAHHGRQRGHGDVRLGRHHLRDDLADLVVHERDAALVGRRAVGLERALYGRGHCASSFGVSRSRSVTMPAKRFLAASRPSSNRPGLASGCDHSGCRVRAAEMARGTQVDIHPISSAQFVGELPVGGQQMEHRDGVAQVALGEVVLLGADHGRRHEVAVARRGVHHQVAAEQLAHQRLEHHVGREDRLAPVVDAGQLLGDLADALPGRVLVPGLHVRGAVEAVDDLGQGQVVQRQVLRGPDPVHAVHRDRVVVHVGRGPAVRVGVQVQPETVVDVHPGADVALHEPDPVAVPLRRTPWPAGRCRRSGSAAAPRWRCSGTG